MNLSKETFLGLLEGKNPSTLELGPIQLAHLYINSAFLVTVTGFLKDQLWLKRQEERDISYCDFMTPLFSNDLLRISFLKDFLIASGEANLKKLAKDSKVIEENVLKQILGACELSQKEFVIESLKEMSLYFLAEEKAQEGRLQSLGHKGPDLYRTFDNLDDLFNLNYQLDRDMVFDTTIKERLYAGAGVGVQSGYSTILLAMENMQLKQGGKVIDLGSGYGRVGLVCSLLRPDVDFIGYEFVPHRVEISNIATKAFGLEENLSFQVQDLSLASFKIPEADVYYLYDPFTKETYHYVLGQIVEYSKDKEITIITKGNARGWLMDIAEENSWPRPVIIDEGNLCVFKTSE